MEFPTPTWDHQNRVFNDSRFWDELHRKGRNAEELCATIQKFVESARAVLKTILRDMPQFTLHDETHILNVLGIMEGLVPDNVLRKLSNLEIGLCILAAYAHDLGMALPADERDRLYDPGTPDGVKFARHRDGFGEELRQIERWKRIAETDRSRAQEAQRRIDAIEAHILEDYLRRTHDEHRGRMEHWIDAIQRESGNQRLYEFDRIGFKQQLVLIGASHGRDVDWLRSQLSTLSNPAAFAVGGTNYAFPGILLRLADILDFDVTRAPHILFRHLGIESDISVQEWLKHQSIAKWTYQQKTSTLECLAQCDHPVRHKSVLTFCDLIETGLRDARDELEIQRRLVGDQHPCCSLELPPKVDRRVEPRNGAYIYEDIQFQLDQDEIQQLLLGESLWGRPDLCIRELLQNALDAVHMRELREELQKQGETPDEPVDPRGPEELAVRLTWGHDKESGQDFLRVSDNGIGMTRRIITDYFTRIGKSYYRSPDFEREKRRLRGKGLLATPISHFGIGILSSFMVADRIVVRTKPGGADTDERRAYDVTISGPGSLFWLRNGSLPTQGTEVTLYLKDGYQITHDDATLTQRLRQAFEYQDGNQGGGTGDKRQVDPAYVAASHVVFPRHPVIVEPDRGGALRIDADFHRKSLVPIDADKVIAKAAEWRCPRSYVEGVRWAVWDWEDNVGDEATGSRIRLQFPAHQGIGDGPEGLADSTGRCAGHELGAFVEPQLPSGGRTRVLVKGMAVQNVDVCSKRLELWHGVGSLCWVDLRGDAATRLTAERGSALEPERADDAEAWHRALRDLFGRFREALRREADRDRRGWVKNWRSAFRPVDALSHPVGAPREGTERHILLDAA
ncbi:hypothetical protein FJZ36_17790, partial [Candidatus Poribacteria bacterium]|nr:hypothetical protein [Candidatus Poribacteria bacterium]